MGVAFPRRGRPRRTCTGAKEQNGTVMALPFPPKNPLWTLAILDSYNVGCRTEREDIPTNTALRLPHSGSCQERNPSVSDAPSLMLRCLVRSGTRKRRAILWNLQKDLAILGATALGSNRRLYRLGCDVAVHYSRFYLCAHDVIESTLQHSLELM